MRQTGTLARQVRLNLCVFAALTMMGLIRVELVWASTGWALAGLVPAALLLLAAVRLPWESLLRRRWAYAGMVVVHAAALAALGLFNLPDPDADVMFPLGAVVITVAAATTIATRATVGLGLAGVAGYLGLMAAARPADAALILSMTCVMLVVTGLCVTTVHNRKLDARTQSKLRRELTRQAFEDPVTGLPNRALLKDRIGTAERRHARTAGRVSLLIIDLDEFKKVNDTLGHPAGDELLRRAATRMTAVLRPADTLARLGGDEFAVLVEDLDDLGLRTVADRLLDAVRSTENDFTVTASLGIATVRAGETPGGTAVDELMRDADLAMYAAKTAGGNQAAFFEPSMYAAAVAEAESRGDMERALAAGEFTVVYQPIVDLPGALPIGVEALVRWQHPTRGLLGPYEFIPQAERTGLITAIGALVLRTALHQVAEWHRGIPGAGRVRVSVNLSARQFSEPGLVEVVRDALADSGIDPGRVVLEITESLLMTDVDATVETLHALRDLGVRIAIDDFGTGYSSLSYLRRFPIDILKIDKAFIDGITVSQDDATLVEAVVGLGRALRLQTVAEGIEQPGQHSMLSELGCTYGQGYLFAKPGTAAEITALVRAAYRTAA